jgi:hypothetical protein
LLSGAVEDGFYALLMGAMRAAIETAAALDAMADDLATAMFTLGSQGVDGTFKTIKVMRLTVDKNLEGFVVFVSANFTAIHKIFGGFTKPGA